MKKYTTIGNCQSESIIYFLESNNNFKKEYELIKMPKMIHEINCEEDIKNMYNIIRNIDLIIIQPISINYKNNENLSTLNILNETREDCKIILFPSLYLDFYFLELTYLSYKGTDIIFNDPPHYHDRNIFELTKKYKDYDIVLKKFKEIYENNDKYSINDLENKFNNTINELIKRELHYKLFIPINKNEKSKIITSSEFIKTNFKEKLLFYSMNHPSKYLLQYISNEILNYLDIIIEEYSPNLDPMYGCIPPIYKYMEKFINFKTNDYKIIHIFQQINNIEDYVNIYYNLYINLNLEILDIKDS